MSGLDVIARGLAVRAILSVSAANRLDRLRGAPTTARDVYPVMAAPPAVTLPPTPVSQISGQGSYIVFVLATDPRLTYSGGRTQPAAAPNAALIVPATMTGLDGNRIAAGMMRIRFMTDAPKLELCFRASGAQINALVDGQLVSRTNGVLPQVDSSGAARYWMMDFGADADAFYLNQAARVANGSGYTVGDIVTVTGGTFTRAAKLRIVSGAGHS